MSLELIEKPLKTAGTKKLKPLSLIFIFELISISTNIKELREKRRLEEIRYREEQEKRWQLKQILEWIDWAKGKAEWLNPLIAKRDPILGKRYS